MELDLQLQPFAFIFISFNKIETATWQSKDESGPESNGLNGWYIVTLHSVVILKFSYEYITKVSIEDNLGSQVRGVNAISKSLWFGDADKSKSQAFKWFSTSN